MKIKHIIAAIALASTTGCATLKQPDIVDADIACVGQGFVPDSAEYHACIDRILNASAQSQAQAEEAMRAFATAFLISSMAGAAAPAPAPQTPLTGLTCTPWLDGVRCVPSP